jgi:uncharacterized membrane protein
MMPHAAWTASPPLSLAPSPVAARPVSTPSELAPPAAPLTSAPQPTVAVERSRWLALIATLALLLLGLGWELAWLPTGRGTLALKVLPLALALPGLWRRRLYTYRWLSLAIWLYVTEGLVRATSEPGRGAALAAAEVLLGGVIFVACAWHVRARLRAPRVDAATGAQPGAST